MNNVKKALLFPMLALMFFSCQKNPSDANFDRSHFYITPRAADSKTNVFLMSGQVGHSGDKCPGCVTSGGVTRHIDCMNYGHYCAFSSYVELEQSGNNITATTIDTFGLTSEDFFLMPDRSLDYVDEKNNHYYLNIPSQLVYRDSTTLQFTFTGLFFSNSPAYEND